MNMYGVETGLKVRRQACYKRSGENYELLFQ